MIYEGLHLKAQLLDNWQRLKLGAHSFIIMVSVLPQTSYKHL